MRHLRFSFAALALLLIPAAASHAQVGATSLGSRVVYSQAPMRDTVFPYSYYTWQQPARVYVPYGTSDIFPFPGQPYGHPYDRWSWATFAGTSSPARYFYPPVR